AACVVVAAGMHGALPTLVAGQIPAPVVALPTSVGCGVAAGGVTAALTMLSAGAPGIGVGNVDNDHGAGHLAPQVARSAPAPERVRVAGAQLGSVAGTECFGRVLQGHLSCGHGDDQVVGLVVGRIEVDAVQSEEDDDGQPSQALVAIEEGVVADDGLEER